MVMSFFSNKRLISGKITQLGTKTIARYVGHRLSFKRPIFVWFSDLVVIHPIVPPEQLILNAIETFAKKDNKPVSNIKIDEIKHVWRNIIEDEKHVQSLYDLKVYQKFTKKKLEDRIRTHYQSSVEEAIIETLISVGYMRSRPSTTAESKIVHSIYRRLTDAKNYYIPDHIRKLLGVLQLRKIKWGIIANSGYHFPKIMHNLIESEKRREWSLGEYAIRILINFEKSTIVSTPMSLTTPICNAIEDGHAKPYAAIFKKALEETERRIAVKPTTAVPLPEVYFVGSSAVVDNNTRVLSSLSIKSVLLTDTLESPTSDIVGLDSNAIQSLNSFRIKDISEFFYALFPEQLARYYCSSSLDMIAEAAVGCSEDSLSLLLRPENIGAAVAAAMKKNARPAAGLSTEKDGNKTKKISIPDIPLGGSKERGVSDLLDNESPEMLHFEVDNSLKPL